MPDYMDIIDGYLEELPASEPASVPAQPDDTAAGFCLEPVPRRACPVCGTLTWQLLATEGSGGAWRWACIGCHPEMNPRGAPPGARTRGAP